MLLRSTTFRRVEELLVCLVLAVRTCEFINSLVAEMCSCVETYLP